mgnify:CR=1 FL=1
MFSRSTNVHAVDKALQAHKDRRGVSTVKTAATSTIATTTPSSVPMAGSMNQAKNDACHGQERHRQHQLNRLKDSLLNHVDVVERACDHRTRAKALKVASREFERLVVHGIADIAGHVGGQRAER